MIFKFIFIIYFISLLETIYPLKQYLTCLFGLQIYKMQWTLRNEALLSQS